MAWYSNLGNAAANLGQNTQNAGLFAGIGYGFNAMGASKSHDRSKNMATRHWLYEQIALKEAGINPGYIFASKGAAGQGGAYKAPQAHGVSAGTAQNYRLVEAQQRNLDSSTAANLAGASEREAQAELHRAKIANTEVDTSRGREHLRAMSTPAGRNGLTRHYEMMGMPKTIAEGIAAYLSGLAQKDLDKGPAGFLSWMFDPIRTGQGKAPAFLKKTRDLAEKILQNTNATKEQALEAAEHFLRPRGKEQYPRTPGASGSW